CNGSCFVWRSCRFRYGAGSGGCPHFRGCPEPKEHRFVGPEAFSRAAPLCNRVHHGTGASLTCKPSRAESLARLGRPCTEVHAKTVSRRPMSGRSSSFASL